MKYMTLQLMKVRKFNLARKKLDNHKTVAIYQASSKHFMPYFVILCHNIPHLTMLYHTKPHYAIKCHTIP